MAFDLKQIKRGRTMQPPRVFLYGQHGIGKTTFAADAPNPFLIQLEDGEGLLDVPRHLITGGYAEIIDVLTTLLRGEHDFATLGIDSVDWLEPMIFAETCARNGWQDIEQPGFGRGYLAADEVWRELFQWLTTLRDRRGMQIILLGHQEVKRFNDPEREPYDRYQPKLQARGSALLREWADIMLFATYKTFITTDDAGFNKKVTRGVSSGDRIMYTAERPSHLAKNRHNLPYEMPLDYGAFQAELVKQLTPTAA